MNQPAEQALICCFSERLHSKVSLKGGKKHNSMKTKEERINSMRASQDFGDLLLGLGFLDVVSSHFDSRRQDGSGKLHHIHTKQMTQFLSS